MAREYEERDEREVSSDAHPGWRWGVLLVPAAAGLAVFGAFLLRSPGDEMGVLLGVTFIAWAASLAMPFFIIAWYAAQAAWKVSRELRGQTFTVPSRDLNRIGFRMHWSYRAQSLVFAPASYDGRILPMLIAGRVVHGVAIGMLIITGLNVLLSP